MPEILLNPPAELNVVDGNIAENYRIWRRQMEIYLLASGADKKRKCQRKAIILHCAGAQVQEVCEHFIYEDNEDSNDPDILLQKLHDYCHPRKNEVLEAYRFWNMNRISSYDLFITSLRTQAEKCNFKDKDRMLRDKLVFTANQRLQEKLLMCSDLTLEKALEICQVYEQTSNSLKEMNKESSQADYVLKLEKADNHKAPQRKFTKDCRFCGGRHEYNRQSCPAWGKTCFNCQMSNHFAVKCKSQKSNNRNKSSTPNQDTCINSITSSCRSSFKRSRELTKDSKRPECRYCGKYHAYGTTVCPARGKECYTCHRLNHFSSQCTRRYHKQTENVAVSVTNMNRFPQNSYTDEDILETDHKKVPPPQRYNEWKGDISETQESEGCFGDKGKSLEHYEVLSDHSDGWLC